MADLMTTSKRSAALAERYPQVRAQTEHLAGPLTAEDQTVQSMPDVSPTKWHRAHTSWFFETFLLEQSLPGYRLHDPMYGYLFNSYYESVGARHPRPARGVISRPGVAEVAAYRAHVDDAMAALLVRLDDEAGLGLVELGLHHEQQHQELLLMDAKHVLSCNPLQPVYTPPPAWWASSRAAAVPARRWIDHPGGLVEIGHGGGGFSFDNESPRHRVALEPFALAAGLVTCGEWAEFVADGGYQRPELWLSDGWAAVQAEGWEAPLYWSPGERGWQVFTLHGPQTLGPAEPVVHVSYYEADAFARWAGARLPTEAEWEAVAADAVAAGGAAAGDPSPRFLEERDTGAVLHPLPGRPGMLGEVWQWTSSAYSPYPGFHPAPGAVGEYNGKFMVNQMVLRGGCCATPAGHARPTYRNFFAPGSRWAFSGLRLARDI